MSVYLLILYVSLFLQNLLQEVLSLVQMCAFMDVTPPDPLRTQTLTLIREIKVASVFHGDVSL